MKYIKWLSLVLLLTGCVHTTPYNQFKNKINVTLEKDHYVLLLVYTPLNCIDCNMIVSHLVNDSSLSALWGQNKFIVYNKIRGIEIADYQKKLYDVGRIKINPINNPGIYKMMFKLAGENDIDNSKPFYLILSPFTGKAYKFDLKDMGAMDKLYHLKEFDK